MHKLILLGALCLLASPSRTEMRWAGIQRIAMPAGLRLTLLGKHSVLFLDPVASEGSTLLVLEERRTPPTGDRKECAAVGKIAPDGSIHDFEESKGRPVADEVAVTRAVKGVSERGQSSHFNIFLQGWAGCCDDCAMARPLRFQYPGAIYHLMARGDGGKAVFETDEDRKAFLVRLRDVCLSHGWRAHAWVLMKNHFHLLVETPEPNLVAGMKWLLGTFSQVWNRARKRRGHVFQGRYKSIPVNGSEADGGYFRSVADYIHLNPARAGLVGGGSEPLRSYAWSSLQAYTRNRPPEWQECGRRSHQGK